MRRTKHNKKRNTALLYEVLIRELTKAVLGEKDELKNKLVKTIKEHFKKSTVLGKELVLYKTLLETEGLDPETAAAIFKETKEQYNKLDKQKIFAEQSTLIKKINQDINKDIFQNFVPNYKNIASVHQIFNGSTMQPKKKVMLEAQIMGILTSNKALEENELKPINNLALKTFVKKFNTVYGSALLTEQQELLKRYVTSFDNNGIELKLFLNEELGRIKDVLTGSLAMEEIAEDPSMLEKTNEVIEIVDSFRNTPVDEELLEQVLKIQKLTTELVS